MEDYKEKYEQTLERAKKFYNRELYAECNGSLVEYIFPELKESNDEKIRKNLIKFFRDLDALEYKEEDIIAWLEKQGEQNHKEKVDEAMREIEEKARVFSNKHKGESSDEILEQMRGEQKPAWSEEDEMFMDELESYVLFNKDFNDDQKAWRIKRLKSIRPQNTWKPSDE